MRKTILGALVLAAACVTPADAVGAGSAVVQCTAEFPVVPAPFGAEGTCRGSVTVAATGVDTWGVPYTIQGSGWFDAYFTYQEPCAVSGQPGVFVSFADGWVELGALPAQHWTNTVATVRAPFSWRRVGLHPVIVVGPAEVWFEDGGFDVLDAGAGTASFVGMGDYSPGVHQCGVGGPLTIDIVATVALG